MHHSEKKGLLREEPIRRAIIAAIDRYILIRNIYQGMATLTDVPVSPASWLHDSMAMQEPYDPARSRALLEQAGWRVNEEGMRMRVIDGTPVPLKLNILVYEEPSGSVRQTAANAIAEMLYQVGINCSVTLSSFERVRERLTAGNFELALCGMNLDVVADPGFLMLGVGTNYCRYREKDMDDLIKNMRLKTGENEYQQAMSEIQHRFVSDAPFMCLYFRNGSLLTRDTFSDVRRLRELELFRGIEAW